MTGGEVAAVARAGPAPPRFRDGLRDAVVVFFAVRLALVAISAIAGEGFLPIPPGQPATDAGFPPPALGGGWDVLVTATQRQDALWYLRLATDGWSPHDASAAFFPLYPLAIRAVAWLPGVGPLGAALALSNAAALGALVVLHALTRLELPVDPAAARRSIRYAAVFPTAFFLLAPYSEAPFLLLSLLAFWFARTDRWPAAAAAGALAALTRSVGAVLIVGLAVEAVAQWRREGRAPAPRLASAAAVAVGPIVYLGWWWLAQGDPWAPLDAQRGWQRVAAWPTTAVWDALVAAWRFRTYWLLDVIVVALAIAGVALAVGRVRGGYLAYAGVSLLLPLLAPFPERPLLSMPRFVAVVFPLAWGYAIAVRRGWLPDALVTGVFAAGYALAAALFVAWQYVF